MRSGDAFVSCYGTSSRGQIRDMMMNIESNSVLKDLILFCSLLSPYYKFTKDVLVYQWMSIDLGEDETTEEVCRGYFDKLVDMEYLVRSGWDIVFNQRMYRIGDPITTFVEKQPLDHKFGRYGKACGTQVQHLSLPFKRLDILKRFRGLQTLVICDSYRLEYLPRDGFPELQSLKILNLSGANIEYTPSSLFANLKELRFLDMSRTPIKWLPESIGSSSKLQTLNLYDCSFEFLPDSTCKLISLQHLFYNARQLQYMPVGIGRLTNLETLNAFVVGPEPLLGRSIRELRGMNKLKGSLTLSRLENIVCKGDALDACLDKKVNLKKVVLRWSYVKDGKNPDVEEIIESLQPPTSIQDLEVKCYVGGVLPSWICNPSFTKLERIRLVECQCCGCLPSLGELPSLKELCILGNVEVVEIDESFCRKQTNEHRVAFPKLEKLEFGAMSNLEKWTGFQNGDFPCLRNMVIEKCPKFVGIEFMSRLNSLLRLEVRYCSEFSCLPTDGPPPSLESVWIDESPRLQSQVCDEKWEGWSKIARVPTMTIG